MRRKQIDEENDYSIIKFSKDEMDKICIEEN
jgi:hypothetical protein